MSKTLFIHIKDPTTDFLERIYKDAKRCTIVRTILPKDVMNDLIRNHDQVVMMGHGCSNGLFGDSTAYIIDERNVEALSRKDNNVFIWCYANKFVENHQLKGFSTGMFISEDAEAQWALGSALYSRSDEHSIIESNYLFAGLVRRNLNKPIAEFAQCIKENYAPENLVAANKNALIYNSEKLKLFI